MAKIVFTHIEYTVVYADRKASHSAQAVVTDLPVAMDGAAKLFLGWDGVLSVTAKCEYDGITRSWEWAKV